MEIRVLGPLDLGEGGTAIPVPAPKHRRLLAALAIDAGTIQTVDKLIDAVWNVSPPSSAPKLLQVYVSQLRKTLTPSAIRTHGSGYALELTHVSLDATRFERLVAEGKQALHDGNPALAASIMRRGLGLWRGPAYGDLAYEDFARPEAERQSSLWQDMSTCSRSWSVWRRSTRFGSGCRRRRCSRFTAAVARQRRWTSTARCRRAFATSLASNRAVSCASCNGGFSSTTRF
jgi:hypothetical protein